MTITNKQLNEYRTQGREIQVMLKSLRRNIEKNDHQFYFASASTYGRVFTLFYNLIRNVYVFESAVQPPCHSGITGNYMNIKSFCRDLIFRFDELTYCLQGNEKYFAYMVAQVARSFFKVLTIKKERSL